MTLKHKRHGDMPQVNILSCLREEAQTPWCGTEDSTAFPLPTPWPQRPPLSAVLGVAVRSRARRASRALPNLPHSLPHTLERAVSSAGNTLESLLEGD